MTDFRDLKDIKERLPMRGEIQKRAYELYLKDREDGHDGCCGHDAPIYGVIEGIIENSGTPYFCFKDLDENKPSCSIRIRVETIDYFLRRHREQIIKRRKAEGEINAQLARLEGELRQQATEQRQEVAAE
ncbi:MAG: hypothetical protein ACRDHZ_18305 [Ktedonobacteraceae bacterium]